MSKAFHTDKVQVRRSFDRAAGGYDGAAVLQREVAERMLGRLDLVKLAPVHVLDAGSGTGYVAARLRERYAGARLIEMDIAAAMLKVAGAKSGWLGRLFGRGNWQVCGDMEAIPLADSSVGMICSNLAIQWLNEPDAAFGEFHRVLQPQGLLMFSTFGPDTLKELRQSFAGVDDKPHVNRFIDMHDLGDALARTGFAGPVMDVDRIVLTYDDIRAAMRDLKAIGAHNVAQGRSRGMFGRHAFERAQANYETLRRDGRLPATYEIIYGHAWKPEPEPKPTFTDGRQVIEFRPRPVASR